MDLQFPPPFWSALWIRHLEVFERIHDNLRHDQPRIFLVVGRNGVPGCVMRAGCGQTISIRLHVVLPIFSLVDVRCTEFPVLVGLVDALQKSLFLFLIRQVKEELDDLSAVSMQMRLQFDDGAISITPEMLLIASSVLEDFEYPGSRGELA